MSDQLVWQDKTVRLNFSRRKTVALHIDRGELELRAPYKTSERFLREFLHSKDSWIRTTLHKQAHLAKERIDYSYANAIPFMGLQVSLLRQPSSHATRWTLCNEGLRLELPDVDDAEATLALLADFYKAQAKFWLVKKTHATVERAALSDRLMGIQFRKTKTKWGHCTADGRIQYNWQIMMAPEPVIDYLVAHEVAHLEHLNHSPSFWALVETLEPDYARHKAWLRRHEHRLTLESP